MIDLAIDKFLSYIQYEKRMSEHTISAYAFDLSQMMTYLEANFQLTEIKAVTYHHLRDWLMTQLQQGVNRNTVKRKASAIKSFYKYLLREDMVKHDLRSKIILPKVAKKLPNYLEVEQAEALLDQNFGEDYKGALEEMIMSILYMTGIRRSELINIKNEDINLDRKQLYILGKRNKERLIPISDDLIKMIGKFNEKKQHEVSTQSNYLLTLESGKKLYDSYVYRVVKNQLSNLTTLQQKSPHVLRHTFATHLSNNGAGINAVKELLGHSSLASTQIYTHTNIEKLKEVYKKTHPKA